MPSENRTRMRSSFPPTPSEIERVPARYLFAISAVSETSEDRTTTGELREYLDVTPASVTEMLSKLDDRGLVDYETYRGATLTDRGEALAMRVSWRFCVVSTFFDSELDTRLDERTAFDIGFVLPKNSVYRLQELSGSPCLDLCPEARHGVDGCVV
ncbi:MAG: metal-dependent transcriptional regulator [Halobacteriales archaeon]|nr:metal-dependent transcriptional regulator [Halobacteriales archaeon]